VLCSRLLQLRQECPQRAVVCVSQIADAGDSLLSQRPFPRRVAASVCALLAALLLLLLAAGLSGCYGCFNHVEKALSEPCFVSHKIVDATDSLLSQRSFLSNLAVCFRRSARFWLRYCCCCLLQGSAVATAALITSRRPSVSRVLCLTRSWTPQIRCFRSGLFSDYEHCDLHHYDCAETRNKFRDHNDSSDAFQPL
jgi:hypothetical protein